MSNLNVQVVNFSTFARRNLLEMVKNKMNENEVIYYVRRSKLC